MRNALINYFNRASLDEQWWSKEELDAWIAAKAAKGKIVTIID